MDISSTQNISNNIITNLTSKTPPIPNQETTSQETSTEIKTSKTAQIIDNLQNIDGVTVTTQNDTGLPLIDFEHMREDYIQGTKDIQKQIGTLFRQYGISDHSAKITINNQGEIEVEGNDFVKQTIEKILKANPNIEKDLRELRAQNEFLQILDTISEYLSMLEQHPDKEAMLYDQLQNLIDGIASLDYNIEYNKGDIDINTTNINGIKTSDWSAETGYLASPFKVE